MTDADPTPTDIAAEVRVFGGMGVETRSGPCSIGGPRQRRLLALLVIRTGELVDLDWLAEYLWDDHDRPATTDRALRTYLSRLRQALPEECSEWIETQPGGYRFAAGPEVVDHLRFAALRTAARTARDDDDPARATELLDEALALWRGAPFRELEDLDWARAEIEQLEIDRLEALEERWEAALALGQHTQITGELAAFTAEHGLRDRAVRQHALALHRSGRTAAALRAIDTHRRRLADETGMDPSTAMLDLERGLLDGDTALDAAPVGRPLRGYRLIEEIGVGAFSIVWRAVQPSVEREVAIKQIRRELASRPEFIRRFEAEARIVARLEHPHIVPLIDYWRDPDAAYLVMRSVRGGTLEQRLDRGPMPVADALAMAEEIGGALAAAHRIGVVHRDVKPANILFDEHGHALLTDFGIALEADRSTGPEAALSPGSPRYAAPEQIRREPLAASADVYSLGVVLFEALTGRPPGDGRIAEALSPVPEHVVAAIERATAPELGDRFTSIAELLGALRDQETEAPPAKVALGENPYVGLRPFDEADAGRFHGRERLVDEITARFGGPSLTGRCVVVVGPSGSGKSSVVRAGLVPAVRSGRAPATEGWFVTTMTPGTDPYASLAAALLRVATDPPADLDHVLRDGPRGVLRGVARCVPDPDQRVLLVVDQLEELFTAAPDVADAFLEALATAVTEPSTPLRLIATLRADFYDRPLAHPGFAPVLKSTALDVTPLAGDELERAIVEPSSGVGARLEAGLAARIAADSVSQPAPLPMLQHTMRELFERRDGAVLTSAAYDHLGGLTGALALAAESIVAEADPDQERAIRRVFGRLTTFEADGADLRRRVLVADLGPDPSTTWVLDRFGAAGLLTFDRDVASRAPTVEVAHEALLREWPRLRDWLRDDAELLRAVGGLARAADAWVAAGREEPELLRGGRIDLAEEIATGSPDRLRDVDRELIAASRAHAEAERAREVGRVRRLRRLVTGVVLALVVAVVAGGLAWQQQRRAQDERDAADAARIDAEISGLVSESAARTFDDPELGILLALEANRRRPGPDTEQAVLNALGSSELPSVLSSLPPPFLEGDPCDGLAVPGDSGLIEFAVHAGRLVTRDPLTGTVVDRGPSPEPCVFWMGDDTFDRRAALTPPGDRLWLGPADGPFDVEVALDTQMWFLEQKILPGGRLVLVTELDGVPYVVVLDDRTGDEVVRVGSPQWEFQDVEVSADGALLAVASGIRGGEGGDGRIEIYDLVDGERLQELVMPVPAGRLTFDPMDDSLVAWHFDGALVTRNARSGATLVEVEVQTGAPPIDLDVRADGLVALATPGELVLVDRVTGAVGPGSPLRDVNGLRIRPDGLLYVITDDGPQVVDLAGSALVEQAWPVPSSTNVGQRGGLAAAALPPSAEAERIDLATGLRVTEALQRADGTPFSVQVAVPEPDGFWAVGPGNEIGRWEDGVLVESLPPGAATDGRITDSTAALFDRDDDGPFVRVVVLERGGLRETARVRIEADRFLAEPRTDGWLYVLTPDDGVLRVHDETGELVHRIDTEVFDPSSIDVDDLTGLVAIPVNGDDVTVIDPASGERSTVPSSGNVTNATFARDGSLLVLIAADGTVRLWDLERDAAAGLLWDGSGSVGGRVSWYDPDADVVWAVTSGQIIAIPMDPASWIERACEVVGRDLTDDEWQRHVPGGGQPVSACD